MNWIKDKMIFYRISEFVLPTLIQIYDKKNHFIFDPVQKQVSKWNFIGCQMPYFMIVYIPYKIIKLFCIKMSIFLGIWNL